MRPMKLMIPVAVCCIFIMSAAGMALAADVKSRSFTPEELRMQEETHAKINTEFGMIELKFFPKEAPNHVANFIELANSGFYNKTIFHRVIPNFMIQGGDPNTKSTDRKRHGTGGPGYSLKAEFNNKPHKRGILSMARSQNPDSAGSQFFICVANAFFLDRQYTVFGEVVSGMDAVDKIVSQPRDKRDNPNDRIEMTVEITGPLAKAKIEPEKAVSEPGAKPDVKPDVKSGGKSGVKSE